MIYSWHEATIHFKETISVNDNIEAVILLENVCVCIIQQGLG